MPRRRRLRTALPTSLPGLPPSGVAQEAVGAVGVGGRGKSGRGRHPVVALVNAKDLTQLIDLTTLPSFEPTMKSQSDQLRGVLVPLLTANAEKPYYSMFLQDFTCALAEVLSSDQIRLLASKLTTLSNEKRPKEMDKADILAQDIYHDL